MLLLTFKYFIAVVGATLLASQLSLDFPTSAGVIAMLSLLRTQKQTFYVAWKRILTAVIGVIICLIVFNVLGYHIASLGIFELIFIPIALMLKAKDGIVVNTVIAMHYLSYGVISPENIMNEMALLGIGIGFGIVLNLHMPDHEPYLKSAQEEIEETMKQFFLSISKELQEMKWVYGPDDIAFKALEQKIKKAKSKALRAQENFIFSDRQDYVSYFQMRLDQFYWMLYMQQHFEKIFVTQKEAMALSSFTYEMAHQFTPDNDASLLLLELKGMREDFLKKDIPKEMMIFENYASLFQFMNDLEIFLTLKVKYLEKDD
jgi:uncharacterized membrane protein YgaE (UPF0421/DUF939 family)